MEKKRDCHPLSFPQKSLWLISQSGVDNGAYNLHLTLKIKTSLGVPGVEQIVHEAMFSIVRRHDQLRSNFALQDDEPVQLVHTGIDFKVHVDASGPSSDSDLETRIRDYSSRPFDLENDILFRLVLLPAANQEIILLLACHHIVLDGLSAEIFFKEFFQYLHALINNYPLDLPLPEKDYHDFVAHENRVTTGSEGERRLQYWQGILDHAMAHSGIPTDFPRPPIFSHHGKAKKFRVNKGIHDFKGHSAFTVLLSAYFILMSRLTGNNDITVVIPMHNREDGAFKHMIGYFVNMTFIRVMVDEGQPFDQLLDTVHCAVRKAREHVYPFQLIFSRLGLTHEPNRFPISDIFFESVKIKAYEPHATVSLGNLEVMFDIELPDIQQESSPGDITVQFYEHADSHYLELRYQSDLFKEESIDGIINEYRDIVNAVIEKPGAAVSDILKTINRQTVVTRGLPSRATGFPAGQTNKDGHGSAPAAETISATDPIQRILLDIWKEVLKQHDINIHDDFFFLGGQSLMAIKVISRINKIFNTNLAVRSFFQNLTIYKLSTVIKKSIQDHEKITLPPIESAGQKGRYPLSYSQERMWFLHELEPESIAYNFLIPLRFLGKLDVEILVKSYEQLVRRHDQLRSNFFIVDGEPAQIIHERYTVYYNFIDLRQNKENPEIEARRIVESEAVHCFDLNNEPLVRLTIIAVTEQNNIVLLNMHHIISDEWSLALITHELNEIYKSSGNDNLEAPPLRYVDFSQWQRNIFTEDAFQLMMKYWEKQLADLPVLNLQTDKKRPAVQTYNGSYYKEKLSDSLIRKIQETGIRHGATAYMVLLTCFYILLYRYSGQEDIPVGSPVANRNRVETEGMIGTFVNTLVLRGDLSGNPSFRELLMRIKETAISAFTHQELPFERLVEKLKPQRDMSILPLAQVMFNAINVPFSDNFPDELEWRLYEIDTVGVQFDLVLAVEYELLKEVTLSYNRDLFEGATARQMLDHYMSILETVLADADARIYDISFMNAYELNRVLIDWNDTHSSYPESIIFSQAFEEQAKNHAKKNALVFQNRTLSYRELNKKANQCARHLISLNFGHGSLIGIYLNRSDQLLVFLLRRS
jgi:hypothetical protein